MAILEHSELDLLLALQAAATDSLAWAGFLSHLANRTGARFGVMVARFPGAMQPCIVTAMAHGAAISTATEALNTILSDRIRPERIYSLAELDDLADRAGDAPVRRAMALIEMTSVCAMRVLVRDVVSLTFGIFGNSEFSAADGAVLRRLFPFLQPAARLAARAWKERLRATTAAGLARRTSLGWVLLDRNAFIIDASLDTAANPRDIRILPGSSGDRLAFAERAVEGALATILDRIATGQSLRKTALRVSRDPPLHLRIAPFDADQHAGPRFPVAIATLHGEYHVVPEAAALLVDLFGLLPSEARLAVALAQGYPLAVAAMRLGLTIATARNYSKKIFATTGVRGQADLVRLIYMNGLAELTPRREPPFPETMRSLSTTPSGVHPI